MSLSKVDQSTLAKDNPYKTLGNADALVKQKDKLDRLAEKEQRELAAQLVLNCPDDELKNFSHAIHAIRPKESSEESFHYMLSRAYEVRCRIKGLHDSANPNPHRSLVAPDFDADLYNEFSELAEQLVNQKSSAIAENLALLAPEEEQSKLARNIAIGFRNTNLGPALNEALVLKRDLSRYLLSDSPYNFFLSTEFNHESCLKFPRLLSLATAKEDQVVTKMAATPEVKRAKILELMTAAFPDSSLLSKTQNLFATAPKAAAPMEGIFQVRTPKLSSFPREKGHEVPSLSL